MTAITPVRITDSHLIGGEKPVFIFGPCVIESEEILHTIGKQLAALSKEKDVPIIFKASFDKANRTSHEGFRGPGLIEGLRMLADVRTETGLPITTDVHEVHQVEALAQTVDLIQLPALLSRQTDLVLACADSGLPTSIKKGQFMAPWDCRPLIDKYQSRAGAGKLIIIERGTSFGYNTLVSDMRALPIIRSCGVPVIYDATHSVQAPGGNGTSSGGNGYLAPSMARAAMAVGVEGLFVETHIDPSIAKSDGPNMIALNELGALLDDIMAMHQAIGRPAAAVG